MRLLLFILCLLPSPVFAVPYALSGEFGDVGSYHGTNDLVTINFNLPDLPPTILLTNATFCEGKCLLGMVDSKTFIFQEPGVYRFQLAFDKDWNYFWGGSFFLWNYDGRFYHNASLVSDSYVGIANTPEPSTLYLILFALIPCFFLYVSNSIWRLSNQDS